MKRTLLMPALAVFMWGCTGNSSHNHGSYEHQEHAVHEHHDEVPADNVKTDNGKKWNANAETTEGIHEMISLAEQQEEGKISIIELREKMDAAFNNILQKCTMTGEAHNQLHHYLLPLKAKYEKLDEKSGKEQIEDIRHYLNSYKNYFQ